MGILILFDSNSATTKVNYQKVVHAYIYCFWLVLRHLCT